MTSAAARCSAYAGHSLASVSKHCSGVFSSNRCHKPGSAGRRMRPDKTEVAGPVQETVASFVQCGGALSANPPQAALSKQQGFQALFRTLQSLAPCLAEVVPARVTQPCGAVKVSSLGQAQSSSPGPSGAPKPKSPKPRVSQKADRPNQSVLSFFRSKQT